MVQATQRGASPLLPTIMFHLKAIIMITKAMKKGEDYAKEQSVWRRNFMGIPYDDFDEYLMSIAFKGGYEAACREIMELIESSKTPNVKVLLERIKE